MKRAKFLAHAGIIAAIYAALTILLAPISYGLAQCRVSEALCILPCFTGAAVPGLFLGCLIANLLTGAPIYDVLFGSLATLLAAVCTRWHAKKTHPKLLLPLPSVLWNAVIVGWLLVSVYGVPVQLSLAMLYVGLGQAVACYAIGLPVMKMMERLPAKYFHVKNR